MIGAARHTRHTFRDLGEGSRKRRFAPAAVATEQELHDQGSLQHLSKRQEAVSGGRAAIGKGTAVSHVSGEREACLAISVDCATLLFSS